MGLPQKPQNGGKTMKWPAWLYRLVPYLGRRAAERDVDEELRLHVDDRARTAARRRRPGGRRPARGAADAGQSLRWSASAPATSGAGAGSTTWGATCATPARGLGRSPGFAATVVLVLALGIGANTAMFSVVHGMLIRPLPYPDAGAIVRITEAMGPTTSTFVTSASMAALLEEAESFEQLAGYGSSSFEWRGPEGGVTLRAARVSPAMFPLLRATPHLGRLFTEGEARAGADRVVLLSHGAWIRRFGSDPDIVGSVIDLNNAPHTVVGVLAEGFFFPSPEEEIWTPYVMPGYSITPPEGGWSDSFSGASFSVSFVTALGRLRPEVSTEQAATEVRTILQRSGLMAQAAAMGAPAAADLPEIDARVVSLQEEMVRGYRPALLALTAATALVLLIACINVAGLLLARGVTRRRALAVCAALGAGRGRLVRQLLTESVVLSGAGGLLGMAAAAVVLGGLPAVVPGNVARLDDVGVNGAGLAFALALSVAVGLGFGAAPAFQWSRFSLVAALNEGSAQAAGGFRLLGSNRSRAALAAAQVALAVVLLVGSGLLLRSFAGLVTVDRGYDPTGVLTARTRNPGAPRGARAPVPGGGEDDAADARFQAAILEAMTRLERLPDVAAVGVSSGLPLASGGTTTSTRVRVAGRPEPADPGDRLSSRVAWASPGYLDAMRLRLLDGRPFTRLDRAAGPGVVVVNETFARDLSRDGQAVGRRVQLGFGGGGDDEPWREVIGVVADIRYAELTVTGRQAEAFVPADQAVGARPVGADAFVTVRTTGDPIALIPFLEEAVVEAHPRAELEDVMTMDARLSIAVAQPRFYAVLVGFFAALAVLLAASGIYGLLSYTVAQRRGEIGIRMALGARRGDILGLVVRQGAVLVADRRRRRPRRRGGVDPRAGELPLRRRHRRPADVRGGAVRAGGGGPRRLLAPRPSRDPGRSDGGPALRLAGHVRTQTMRSCASNSRPRDGCKP